MIMNCNKCDQPTDLSQSIIVRFDVGTRKDYLKYKCSQCSEITKDFVTQEEQINLGNGGVATLSNPGDVEPTIDNYFVEPVIEQPDMV
jgi:hypothetical protein